jgi:hypothetical protein
LDDEIPLFARGICATVLGRGNFSITGRRDFYELGLGSPRRRAETVSFGCAKVMHSLDVPKWASSKIPQPAIATFTTNGVRGYVTHCRRRFIGRRIDDQKPPLRPIGGSPASGSRGVGCWPPKLKLLLPFSLITKLKLPPHAGHLW